MSQKKQPAGRCFENHSRPPAHFILRDALMIAVGSVIYALAISLFLNPNRLAPGGVSGVAVLIHCFSGWNTGLLILLLNVPIAALGLWKLGARAMLRTIVTTLLTSALIDSFSALPPATGERLLAAPAGGALLALGMALVFKANATTGGVDILVRILRASFPQFKSGTLFLLIDSCVAAAAGIVFRNVETALYTALVSIIFSFLFDHLLYGGDSAKLLYIISAEHEAIAHRLLYELGVGVTYLDGSGAYTKSGTEILLCALKNHAFPKAHAIVLQEDPDAFFIVGQASEIYGAGFKDPRAPLQ